MEPGAVAPRSGGDFKGVQKQRAGAVAVQGNVSSVSFPQLYVGRNGTGYPYGPATSQGKMINATDYAPLTPFYFNNSTAAWTWR